MDDQSLLHIQSNPGQNPHVDRIRIPPPPSAVPDAILNSGRLQRRAAHLDWEPRRQQQVQGARKRHFQGRREPGDAGDQCRNAFWKKQKSIIFDQKIMIFEIFASFLDFIRSGLGL